ncbi:MAG TPA: HAMP domain-containing sensor histidine kinase [Bacteriovoracaceae bacterium]|nr:HAMP domain-containing sensor histidine kinase [Bacteriovoracaceae bacterium]
MHENETSRLISANRSYIIELWESEVRKKVNSASQASKSVLINTLPVFLTDLAEAVAKNDPAALAMKGSTLAGDHGGERARLTKYSPESIIDEYRILRKIIYQLMDENVNLDKEARKIIFDSIEEVTMLSIKGFFESYALVKEQFTLTLTHDLRNPLNASKMAVEMILRNKHKPEKVTEMASKVLNSINRIDQMIQTLLDASRLRVGEKLNLKIADVELRSLLNKVVDDLTLTHGARFKIVSPEEIFGKWDNDALERVMENLLTNAIKYGDNFGEITITAELEFSEVLVKVHNRGSYIPMNERDKLFSLFKQVKANSNQNQKGWGVGLLMVKGVMEAHGGSVTVESHPEDGTTFILTLPLNFYEGTINCPTIMVLKPSLTKFHYSSTQTRPGDP